MRRLLLATVVVGLLLGTALPALAHAGLVPRELSPDVAEETEIVLPHGCGPEGAMPDSEMDASPITAVTVEEPDGVHVRPLEAAGWSLTQGGEAGGIRWTSDDPAGVDEVVRLGIVVEIGEVSTGTEVPVPVVQECADGSRMAWVHPEVGGDADRLPAPRLVVGPGGSEGLSTPLLVALVLAAALVVGGVVVVGTLRR